MKSKEKKAPSLRMILENLALFTAVPADLIAILPVIYGLLTHLKIIKGDPITLPATINIGVSLPVQNIAYALVFYGFVAFAYRTVNKDNIAFVRDICIGLSLLVAFPVTLLLITFGKLSLSDGLAVAVLCLVTTYYYRTRFHFDKNDPSFQRKTGEPFLVRMGPMIEYREIGIWYFLWVGFVWISLQIDSTTSLWIDFEWAFLYTAIGYIASILVVILVGFIWRILKDGVSGWSFRRAFAFQGNWLSTLALIATTLIPYIILGFLDFSTLIVRIVWMGIYTVILLVCFVIFIL